MRQLKIDLAELEFAFESSSEMISNYLDLDTGELIMVSDDELSLLESIIETSSDEPSQPVDWQSVFEDEHVPEWQRERLMKAYQVETGLGERFISIAGDSSHEGYQDMKAFIVTIHDRKLLEQLDRAINGRGAFRNFKDVLSEHPAERERWFQFKQERLHQRVLDWLESQDITPIQ